MTIEARMPPGQVPKNQVIGVPSCMPVNSGGATTLFHGSSLYRDQFITRAGSLLLNFIELTESASSVLGAMLSTNFFAVVTLLLAKTKAYYVPSNSYVIPVAESPQYLYTPSEHAEELSGYSYVTSDLNGARSNVIFTNGPGAAGLFRNQASAFSKLIDSMAPGRSIPRPIDTTIPGSSISRPIDTIIPGSSIPKPIDTKIPDSPTQNPIQTVKPGSSVPKPIGTVIPESPIQRENANQAQVSYQQFPLFQPHASLFYQNLHHPLAATSYNRHYSAPLTVYDHNADPYVYNPYVHLHSAIHPAPAYFHRAIPHYFYPQTVSSSTNSIENTHTGSNESTATEEENFQQNVRINNSTIDSEVIADQSDSSEHSENMTELAAVRSTNATVVNEEVNATEASVGRDNEEIKSEDKSLSASMEHTIDMTSTVSTSNM